MSKYTVKMKLWTEIEVEAASKEDAQNKVWEIIDSESLDIDIGEYIPIWIEVSDVVVK